MGCDIHMYVEYGEVDRNADAKDEGVIDITPNKAVAIPTAMPIRWHSFGGRIHGDRNYWIFGALAGVRNDSFEHTEPRGLPNDLAYEADGDAWMRIDYGLKEGEEADDGECSEADAIRYQQFYHVAVRGSYKPHTTITRRNDKGETTTEIIGEAHKGKPTHVADPDWHSHSWLTPMEFRAAINRYRERTQEPKRVREAKAEAKKYGFPYKSFDVDFHTYSALASLLEALHKPEEGVYARIVFWFDN